jgi:hypothetical protein
LFFLRHSRFSALRDYKKAGDLNRESLRRLLSGNEKPKWWAPAAFLYTGGVTRIGPAGWAYKDWNGIAYPAKMPKGFDPIAYLARYFDTIEINSTFYGPARPGPAKESARRVA